jgi:hypothetical protein
VSRSTIRHYPALLLGFLHSSQQAHSSPNLVLSCCCKDESQSASILRPEWRAFRLQGLSGRFDPLAADSIVRIERSAVSSPSESASIASIIARHHPFFPRWRFMFALLVAISHLGRCFRHGCFCPCNMVPPEVDCDMRRMGA